MLSLVFPNRCIGCEKFIEAGSRRQICDDCFGRLLFLKTPAHLPRLDKQYFDEAHSAVGYEGSVLDWVHQFKYHRQFHLIPALIDLMLQNPVDFQKYEAMTYVPLHWRRRWRRGFNPAHLLADTLAKKRGVPILHVLKKTRGTKPQAKMDAAARLQNVKNAFACLKNRIPFAKEKTLLLIDDVLTTGATVNECAKVLKKAGAKRVDVLTLARAL